MYFNTHCDKIIVRTNQITVKSNQSEAKIIYPLKIDIDPYCDWYGEDYLENEKFVRAYLHKDYQTKMHSHQFYEINIIISGNGRHYISDTSIPATVGDVFVIPPNIPHGYFSEATLDIYHILIKNDFINRYREELLQLPAFNMLFDFEPLLRRFSGTNFNLNIGINRLDAVKKDLDNIQNAENEHHYLYENVLVLELIAKLGKLFKKRMFDTDTYENTQIIRIMEYIKENLGEKLTLSKIAKFGNISTATLNRRFKELLGQSPMQYVMNCRIILARELIEEKRLNKTEIAQVCGFYDLVHLNKCLAKAETLS